jgi:uncharacterized membrane protein
VNNDLEASPGGDREQGTSSQADASFSGARIAATTKVMAWNTKFPPAAYFEEFAHIIPEGAERLFEHFIAESEHRRILERRKQIFPLIAHVVGRAGALIFALSALGVAAISIVYGAHWIAAVFGGGMIASVVTVFVKFSPEQIYNRKNNPPD